MLSLEELLKPLPSAQHVNTCTPSCPPATHCIMPDFDATARKTLLSTLQPKLQPVTRNKYCSLFSPPQTHPASTQYIPSLSQICPQNLTEPMRLPRLIYSALSSHSSTDSIDIQYNVFLNRKTTLKKLFHYPVGAFVEYPETSAEGSIGHLFDVSPDDWSNPHLNFIYSQGQPSGRMKKGEHIFCGLLVDGNGVDVPCWELHSTCM